jgi:hypothetical protein
VTRIFSRGLLAKAFPNQPRLRGQIEALDDSLSEIDEKRQKVSDMLDGVIADFGDGGKYQQASAILDAIAALPSRIGAIEMAEGGEAKIRPIDGQDPASLVTRGAGYSVFVGIAGTGSTANRPVFPMGYVGIYFDTDIDPDGQPIIRRTDGVWLNMSGVPV